MPGWRGEHLAAAHRTERHLRTLASAGRGKQQEPLVRAFSLGPNGLGVRVQSAKVLSSHLAGRTPHTTYIPERAGRALNHHNVTTGGDQAARIDASGRAASDRSRRPRAQGRRHCRPTSGYSTAFGQGCSCFWCPSCVNRWCSERDAEHGGSVGDRVARDPYGRAAGAPREGGVVCADGRRHEELAERDRCQARGQVAREITSRSIRGVCGVDA